MADFHDRIWELYESARDKNYKIGRKEFAKQTNVRLGQMNGWLSRVGKPNCDTLRTIAEAHHVSVSWLVGETNVRTLDMPPLYKDLPPKAVDALAEYAAFLRKKYAHKKPEI